MRIKTEFEDGESCTVTLKDRFKPQEEESQLWYSRAFGPQRNMMKVKLSFTPPPGTVDYNAVAFYAKVNYTMFSEMQEGEFKDELAKYEYNDFIKLDKSDGGEIVSYGLVLEMPYGLCSPKIYSKEIPKGGAEPTAAELAVEPQEVPEDFSKEYFNKKCTPEPISREM